ncbi:DUF6788 family protein [Methanothrix sp.]
MLQKVKCGNPSCRCAGPGGELHGPHWYHNWKMDRKTKRIKQCSTIDAKS